MFDIYVERVIDKDINYLFDLFANVEGYSSFRGVQSAELLEPANQKNMGLALCVASILGQ